MDKTKRLFTNVVWKEGKYFVAQCLNVDVSSFGKTYEEALKNLQEATELYLEDAPKGSISQKGSHGKFRKEENKQTFTAIVPMAKKEIPRGTFNSILRQSGLKKEAFD